MWAGNGRLFGACAASHLRQVICLILLAAAGQGVALPLIDHHAVEYSPLHTHFVQGAGNLREAAWALAHHAHTFERPHAHDPASGLPRPATPTGPARRLRLTVVSTGGSPQQLMGSLLALDIGFRRPADLGLPPLGLWRRLAPPAHFDFWAAAAPPAPPPRAA